MDVGDLCLDCGRSTAPGSGRWVNRIAVDRERDSVDPALAARYPGVELFDGWWCAECQSVACEACEDERGGAVFRPIDYVGRSGCLCDTHASGLVCAICGETLDDPSVVTELTVAGGAGSLAHRHHRSDSAGS